MAKDRLYQRANVFVMPSVSEPFGIVALEAAIVGVPVIVSKTSGVAEVLPSAIKLDYWDVDKMAESVLALINKTGFGKELGQKVMEEAGAITWEKAAMKIKEAYQQLLISTNV
jgi:glycosyltransferase involved in cell wall biosynthesis